MSKLKSSARSRKTARGKTAEVARAQAHTAVIDRLREAVFHAVNPRALCRLLWEGFTKNKVDIDRVVDQLARTHEADGCRDPLLQKDALDALRESLFGSLPESQARDFNTFADRHYSRFILSFDVGFEAGFAAAQALLKGGGR